MYLKHAFIELKTISSSFLFLILVTSALIIKLRVPPIRMFYQSLLSTYYVHKEDAKP